MHLLRKIVFFMLVLTLILCISSCYYYESDTDYETFITKNAGKAACQFLPDIKYSDNIIDMYLFYSDRDLIDTYHTFYVKCKYSESQYNDEKERIKALFTDEDFLEVNSDSFYFESMLYGNVFDWEKSEIMEKIFDSEELYGIMEYEYVLFDRENLQIIYVSFFDKELNGKSTNIPKEYLPKELVALRESIGIDA